MDIFSFLAPHVCFFLIHSLGKTLTNCPSVKHSGSSARAGDDYVCRVFLSKWVFKGTYLHPNKTIKFCQNWD